MGKLKLPGQVYLILAVIILASSNAVVKKLTTLGAMVSPQGVNPITFCNVLFIGNLCALLTLILVYHRQWDLSFFKKLTSKDWAALSAVAILSVALAPAIIFTALQYTTVTSIVLIGRIEPPLLLFLSIFLLKEKANIWQILGSTVACGGVVAIILLQQKGSSGFSLGKGEILAAIGAISFCCSTIISKKSLQNIPLGIFAIFRMFVGTILFFAIATYLYGLHHFEDAFSPLLWKWMLIYGSIIVVAGQLCWFKGLRESKACDASFVSSFSPIAGIAAAFLILAETPTSSQYIGGAIILLGICVGQYGNFQLSKEEKDKEACAKKSMDTEVGFKGI